MKEPAQKEVDQAVGWADAMRGHYQTTGSYRAGDLNRLLGDPRDSVSLSAQVGVRLCSRSSSEDC
jgi:hypothetical protein